MEGKTVSEEITEQSQQIDDPQLLEAVKKQIEYYFSKENLSTDAYLTSQMDAQQSVAISVVMKFSKLKALTKDENVIRKALVDSSLTVVDNRIKANIKAEKRTTIILRDIPTETSEEEVREIFNYDGCKNIVSVRGDIGDTWFVVLDSEEDAKDTLIDLRVKKRTFRDKSIKARVKTEATIRSFYPTSTPPAPIFPMMPFPPMGPNGLPLELPPFGFMPPVVDPALLMQDPLGIAAGDLINVTVPVAPTVSESEAGKTDATADGKTDASANTTNNTSSNYRGKSSTYNNNDRNTTRKPRTTTGKDSNSTSNTTTATNGDNRRRSDCPPRASTSTTTTSSASSGRKEQEKTQGKEKEEKDVRPPIEVNAMTFPPLANDDINAGPVPTPGYKSDFLKFTFEEIITIVKNVREASLPEGVDTAAHCHAVQAEPNMDLLRRQRTFTIDETREQLRMGRPVQREAIISGQVDYRSMMFGDDPNVRKFSDMSVGSNNGNTNNNKNTEENAKTPATNKAHSIIFHAPDSHQQPTQQQQQHTERHVSHERTVSFSDNLETPKKSPFTTDVASPNSPPRITASTWAAMLKSSAADSTPVVDNKTTVVTSAAPVAHDKAVKTNTATTTSNSSNAKGKKKDKETTNTNNTSSNNSTTSNPQQKEKKESRRGKDKSNKTTDEGNATATTTTTTETSTEGNTTTNSSSTSSSDITTTTAAAAPAKTWGGKVSFAMVLKQNVPEGSEATTTATATTTTVRRPAATTSTANKDNKSNNNKDKKKDDHRRDRNSNNNSSSSSSSSTNTNTNKSNKDGKSGADAKSWRTTASTSNTDSTETATDNKVEA